ncbi:MAG: outer membrane protein transport protein [Myxococcota bacterium]
MWLLALLAAPAAGTVPDLMGLGARLQGAGGGGVAAVDDGTAAYVNPAGLSFVRRPTAALGYVHAWPRFAEAPPLWWDTNRDGIVDEHDPPLQFDANPPSMGGVQLQASRNVGGKFGVGITAYVPLRNLIRFATFEPSLPNYVMYSNRPQRFVAAAAVGGQILPGLSIGAGANLLARAKVRVAATLAASVQPPDPEADQLDAAVSDVVIDVHDIDFSLVPAVAPVAGLQLDVGRLVDVLDGLRVGAVYQGRVGLPIDVDVDLQANAEVAGFGDLEPFVAAAVARGSLALFDHYVPQRVNLGLAYEQPHRFMAYADVRWTDWRGLVLNVARVEQAELASPFVSIDDGTIRDGNDYTVTVRATWGVRGGVEVSLPQIPIEGRIRYVQLALRAGGGFDPTPLVSQGPTSAFLDTDRTWVTAGLGLEHWDPFALTDGAVRFDFVFQWHWLAQAQLPRGDGSPRPARSWAAAPSPSAARSRWSGRSGASSIERAARGAPGADAVGASAPRQRPRLRRRLAVGAARCRAAAAAHRGRGPDALPRRPRARHPRRPALARPRLGRGGPAAAQPRLRAVGRAARRGARLPLRLHPAALAEHGGVYPGTCRDAGHAEGAARFRSPTARCAGSTGGSAPARSIPRSSATRC